MKEFLEKIKQKLPMQTLRKIRSKFGTVPFPGWLFVLAMALFCECMVHFWVAESFSFGRFAAVAAFALGFGCLLATLVSFFGWKNLEKWVALAMAFLLVVLYLVEYFVSQAYQVFMPLGSVLNGAKGVATDFADVVINVVISGMWRILLFLLPLVLFGLFAKTVKTSWRVRWFLTVGIAVCYLLGYNIVQSVGVDADRLKSTYEFDSAVRVFGLNTALGLDYMNSSSEGDDASGGFVVEAPPPTQPTQPTQPAEEETQPTEPIVYEPNVMDFDFGAMAEAETYKRIAKIHSYVNSVQPSMQNEYTGLFAGKNLVVVVAEAFSKEVIDPELTPTLYRMATQGIQFHDYYQPMWGGSTSTGEFSVLTGLVAGSGTNSVREAIQQDLFLTYGKQFGNLGYNTFAYHNHLHTFYDRHETHPEFGYDTYMGLGNGMEEGVKERWPESDLEMIDFTVPQFIDQQPFCVYYMTVSGHCRYNRGGNKMSGKNYEVVQDLPYSETVKCYIAANLELEYAMASLVRQLEAEGIADDTVIVLTTDHYPYGLEKGSTYDNKEDFVGELYGYKYNTIIERDHSALIIWSGSIEGMNLEVTTPTYSLDILPTVSNLFGLEYDSRLLVGRDVFSDQEPLVLWYNHTWKTELGYYDSSNGKFYPNEGVEVDEEYVERIKTIVSNKIYYSREVQSTDYFDYLREEMDKWETQTE